MADEKYLAIKNWESKQAKMGRREWVRDYTEKDGHPEYSRLSAFQRYVLDGLQRLRGRRGENPENDATWIAQALHMLGTDRPHLRHALDTLVVRGLLIPTNQQHDPIEEIRREEKRVEDKKQTAIVETVAELPKPTTKPTLAIVEPHVFELPVWLNQATWTDYELMRRKKGAPMTNRARELIVGKLKAFMEKGQNPERVLEESIANNWTGVFELKEQQNGRTTDSTKPDGPSAAVEILRARLADRGLPRPTPNAGNAGLPPSSQDSRRH